MLGESTKLRLFSFIQQRGKEVSAGLLSAVVISWNMLNSVSYEKESIKKALHALLQQQS